MNAIGREIAGFFLLAATSLCAGLLLNRAREHPISLVYTPPRERAEKTAARLAPSTAAVPSVAARMISLTEFREIVDGKKGLVIDARPGEFYRFGHVPGAVCIPREDLEKGYRDHQSQVDSAKTGTIAVYCSDASCDDSSMVADALIKLGCAHVLVFKGGWDEWTAAGLPQETNPK